MRVGVDRPGAAGRAAIDGPDLLLAAAVPVPRPGPMTMARHFDVASRNGVGPPWVGRRHPHRLDRPGARRDPPACPAGSCPRRRPWRPRVHSTADPSMPTEPAATPSAVLHLCDCRGRAGSRAAMSASSISAAAGVPGPIADVGHRPPSPLRRGPVPWSSPGFEAAKVTVWVARTAPRRCRTGVGVDARGHVDGQDRAPAGHRRGVVGAVEPGAVGAVDHQVARRRAGRGGVGRVEHGHPAPRAGTGTRRPRGRRPRCCPCRPPPSTRRP